MDATYLQRVPETYRQVYKDNWRTIKENTKVGRLRDVLHFPLFEDTDKEIVTKARQMIGNYNSQIKVNVAFGFILKNRTNDDLRFFHPSNNTMLFSSPRLLARSEDFNRFLSDIEMQDAFEYAQLQRPSTNWKVERIVCVRFDVYKLRS